MGCGEIPIDPVMHFQESYSGRADEMYWINQEPDGPMKMLCRTIASARPAAETHISAMPEKPELVIVHTFPDRDESATMSRQSKNICHAELRRHCNPARGVRGIEEYESTATQAVSISKKTRSI